jgi:hypothetical protein
MRLNSVNKRRRRDDIIARVERSEAERSPWWVGYIIQALKGWNNKDYGAPTGLVKGAASLPGAPLSFASLHPWLLYRRAFGAPELYLEILSTKMIAVTELPLKIVKPLNYS